MSLKHLRIIEEYFKKNPNDSFTRTDLRDILNIHYGNVLDALAYLEEHTTIKKVMENNKIRYKLEGFKC